LVGFRPARGASDDFFDEPGGRGGGKPGATNYGYGLSFGDAGIRDISSSA
jgi:hypothetical protein